MSVWVYVLMSDALLCHKIRNYMIKGLCSDLITDYLTGGSKATGQTHAACQLFRHLQGSPEKALLLAEAVIK